MKTRILAAALLTGLTWGQASAQTVVNYVYDASGPVAVDIVPTSTLDPSTQYYTEMAGMGLGSIIVTTGGGNEANAGVTTGRNDDGFSGPIALNFSTPFSFFGNTYTALYANNNGNVTFGGGNASYTPSDLLPGGASMPVISPFFADVDTRLAPSGVMYLNQTVANQTIVTWDQVGYYNQQTGLLNSFQLVIRGAGYAVPTNEGMVGFFWKTMQWEVGAKSGGAVAAVGFGDGLGSGLMLEDSTVAGVAGLVQDHHIWFNIATASPPPPPVPEPETYAMLLAGLGLLGFTARRRKQPNV
ncbi:MAG: hypothetical protein FD134_282 [Gallionellaceae bacterium]|nr:MAG: hypothetical protein FD134_282 [Gallionellaceae bacterium]